LAEIADLRGHDRLTLGATVCAGAAKVSSAPFRKIRQVRDSVVGGPSEATDLHSDVLDFTCSLSKEGRMARNKTFDDYSF